MICLSSAGSLRWPQVGCWSMGLSLLSPSAPVSPFSTALLPSLSLSLHSPFGIPCLGLTPTFTLTSSLLSHSLPRIPLPGTLSFVPLEGAGRGCMCIRYCYDTTPPPCALSSRGSPQQGPRKGGREEGTERMQKRGQGIGEGKEGEGEREERDGEGHRTKRERGGGRREERERKKERERERGLEDTASFVVPTLSLPLTHSLTLLLLPLFALSRGL